MVKKKYPLWWSLLFCAIYLVFQGVMGAAFGIIAVLRLFITDIDALLNPTSDVLFTELITKITMPSVLISALLSATLVFFIYKWRKYKPKEFFQFNKFKLSYLLIGILAGIGALFVSNFIATMLSTIFPSAASSYAGLMDAITKGGLAFITVGIIGPIVEEIIFRGAILNELNRKYNITIAIIVQALLFGLIHMNLIQSTYAFVIGLLLGLLVAATKSIWPGIVGHILMNSSSLLIDKSASTTDFIDKNFIVLLIIATLIVAALIVYSIKLIKQSTPIEEIKE